MKLNFIRSRSVGFKVLADRYLYGSAKPTRKDRKKFYSISLGSLREVQLILDLNGCQKQLQSSDPVAACLYKLIQNPGGCN